MQHKTAELGSALSRLSKAGEPVDMAYALMCETMDVLGLAGFNKEYHNVDNLSKKQPAKVLDVSSSAIAVAMHAHLSVSTSNKLADSVEYAWQTVIASIA